MEVVLLIDVLGLLTYMVLMGVGVVVKLKDVSLVVKCVVLDCELLLVLILADVAIEIPLYFHGLAHVHFSYPMLKMWSDGVNVVKSELLEKFSAESKEENGQ